MAIVAECVVTSRDKHELTVEEDHLMSESDFCVWSNEKNSFWFLVKFYFYLREKEFCFFEANKWKSSYVLDE